MKIAVVVFSRISSRRFPGKALADLRGRPLLGRVLDRAKLSARGVPVIVATSNDKSDEPIVTFCATEGTPVYRGPLDDVLGRAVGCACANDLDAIVRITGDSPFADPEIINECINFFSQNADIDLITNARPRSFPIGMTVELIPTKTLKSIYASSPTAEEREHITTRIYTYAGAFDIRAIINSVDYSELNLSVDTPDDLRRVEWIMDHLSTSPTTARRQDIIDLAIEYASA